MLKVITGLLGKLPEFKVDLKNPKDITIIVILIALIGGGGFMFGKGGTKPEVQIKEKEKVVQMAKSHTDSSAQFWASMKALIEKNTETIKTVYVVKKPDGTVEEKTETKVIDKDRISINSDSGGKTNTETKTEVKTEIKTEIKYVEKPADNWRASALVGVDELTLKPDVYGGAIERRIIGPLWVGVSGNTNREFFLSLSVEF